MSKGFCGIEARKVLDKNDNSVSLIFSVPRTSLYYDGHFPGFPVLPAVAQLDIVINFASNYFGYGIALFKIKQMKFIKTITTSLTLLLKIEIENNSLFFKIDSEDGKENYSKGTLILASSADNA